ncbi:MAG: hypothetical protein AAF557_18530 [Pseudomonadota bacterium]
MAIASVQEKIHTWNTQFETSGIAAAKTIAGDAKSIVSQDGPVIDDEPVIELGIGVGYDDWFSFVQGDRIAFSHLTVDVLDVHFGETEAVTH